MRLCPFLFVLALAGCELVDPYERPGIWRPNGSNDADLAIMVADPADLARGHGEDGGATLTSDGHLGAAAVTRLRQDRTKALPPDELTSSGSGAPGGSPGGGGSSGGGAAPSGGGGAGGP